jgi:hypothetical protein
LVGDVVFSELFVNTHPELLAGKRVDALSITGVGGAVQVQVGRTPALALGSLCSKDWSLFPSNAAGALANGRVAGILGKAVSIAIERRSPVTIKNSTGRIPIVQILKRAKQVPGGYRSLGMFLAQKPPSNS